MRFKGLATTFILSGLLISSPISSANFTDVQESNNFFDAINYLKENKIVQGYKDGSYQPEKKINRGEFTKIIIAAYFDETEIKNCDVNQLKFSDLPKDQWFSPYICTAFENKIIKGFSDNTFRHSAEINYGEAAKIISVTEALFNKKEFPKNENEPWHQPFIKNIQSNDAQPQSIKDFKHQITRGEMAYIIYKTDKAIFPKDNLATMSAKDCLPGEKFDQSEKVCYIECSSEKECQEIEKAIASKANSIGEDYFNGEKDYHGNHHTPTSTPENQSPSGLSETEITLTTYKISGDTLSEPTQNKNIPTQYQKAQSDLKKHQEMWNLFTKLIPATNRKNITEFQILSDGKDGTLAAVSQKESNPKEWILYIDPLDAYQNNQLNKSDLTYSIIHEFGHVLTLSHTQIPVDSKPAINNHNSEKELQAFMLKKEQACGKQLFVMEGCTLPKSYLNLFYQKFWTQIHQELKSIQKITDPEKQQNAALKFFEKHQDKFVTEYASSNPGEDIAESWTAFVLKNKPETNQIKDQKVKFFYQFPELVKLRKIIRSRLK